MWDLCLDCLELVEGELTMIDFIVFGFIVLAILILFSVSSVQKVFRNATDPKDYNPRGDVYKK